MFWEHYQLVRNIMQLEKNLKTTVAIIGGGRWAQVTLSVLANMNLPYHYVVVSNANYNEILPQLSSLETSFSTFSLVHTINDLLARFEVASAIIVNAAREHFASASKMINNGSHVLIEKPIVLTSHEMNFLIEDARDKGVIITPGLCYRFCSYIHNFALEVKTKGIPCKFHFEWFDEKNEIRHGNKKRHDHSINVVQDVIPHVWSILSTIFTKDLSIVSCRLNTEGDRAEIAISTEGVRGTVVLNRYGHQRKRYLSVEFTSGKSISIDFTTEPGLIVDENKSYSGDAGWEGKPSPLEKQFGHFFSSINNNTSDSNDIQACMQSVSFTDAILMHLET